MDHFRTGMKEAYVGGPHPFSYMMTHLSGAGST